MYSLYNAFCVRWKLFRWFNTARENITKRVPVHIVTLCVNMFSLHWNPSKIGEYFNLELRWVTWKETKFWEVVRQKIFVIELIKLTENSDFFRVPKRQKFQQKNHKVYRTNFLGYYRCHFPKKRGILAEYRSKWLKMTRELVFYSMYFTLFELTLHKTGQFFSIMR